MSHRPHPFIHTHLTHLNLQRLARKMTTFGVDFQKHLKATNRCIPIIVMRCIEEIDERALDTRGLYRISCAKTKLEHLCQLFESGAERVDLSDRPSHLIGSCLKLYFRQVHTCTFTCMDMCVHIYTCNCCLSQIMSACGYMLVILVLLISFRNLY